MKHLARAVLLLLLAFTRAVGQPTPLPEVAPVDLEATIRTWVAEQNLAVPALQQQVKEQEAKLLEFRGYLGRMRSDAVAQKAQVALGSLRRYDFSRAQRNWTTWRDLAQARLTQVEATAELLAGRQQEEEERWALLGDQTAADLGPLAVQGYQQAQGLHKLTVGLLDRLQALATSGGHDAKAGVELCDEILQLIDRTLDRMRSRFFLDRTTPAAVATAPDDVRKESAALVDPLVEGMRGDWLGRLGEALQRNAQIILSGALLWALILWRVRSWSAKLEGVAVGVMAQAPTLLRRLVAALLLALIRNAVLAFLTSTAIVLAGGLYGAKTGWVRGILELLRAFFAWRLAVAFVRVGFDPARPDHLLFDLPAEATRFARRRLEILALWFFVGLVEGALVDYVSLTSPPLMLVFLVTQLLALGSIMRSLGDERLATLGLDANWSAAASHGRVLLRGTIILLLGVAALGFINLAWFVAWSIVKLNVLLLLGALLWRVGVEVLEQWYPSMDADVRRGLRRLWSAAVGIAVVVALLLVTGTMTTLARWSGQVLAFGVEVGGRVITVGNVLGAFLSVASAWVLGRVINAVLTQRVFPRALIDAGVRDAITTTIGYVVIALGVLLGIRALGFDLTSFAIVAGALSVGAGFGMQTLVSNFVSGLIILYERPFRPGDILEHGGVMGSVKKIRTRSTIVQTFDEAELVLPNSDLLSKPITNWTLSNHRTRATIPVGVAYGSDVELVRDTLLEVATAHPRVEDEPQVFFVAFGDSSLDFRLMIWVDVREKAQIVSDVHFSIEKAFRAKHIEIPFPRRDVHIHAPGGSE